MTSCSEKLTLAMSSRVTFDNWAMLCRSCELRCTSSYDSSSIESRGCPKFTDKLQVVKICSIPYQWMTSAIECCHLGVVFFDWSRNLFNFFIRTRSSCPAWVINLENANNTLSDTPSTVLILLTHCWLYSVPLRCANCYLPAIHTQLGALSIAFSTSASSAGNLFSLNLKSRTIKNFVLNFKAARNSLMHLILDKHHYLTTHSRICQHSG